MKPTIILRVFTIIFLSLIISFISNINHFTPSIIEAVSAKSDENLTEVKADKISVRSDMSDSIEYCFQEPVDEFEIEPELITLLTETTPEAILPLSIQVNSKMAYLTFDDGPNRNNTGRILEILDEYGIKATFFVVGEIAERYPDELVKIYDTGHAVGCHSYDHLIARCSTAEGIEAEIFEWEAAVSEIIGEVPSGKLFRFPGGSPIKDVNGLRNAVSALGYRGFDWNCLNNDCLITKCPSDMSADEWLKQSFLDTYKYGSSFKNSPLIVLMHETYTQTADMLGWMIEFLISEGYSFGTLDMVDGNWYY